MEVVSPKSVVQFLQVELLPHEILHGTLGSQGANLQDRSSNLLAARALQPSVAANHSDLQALYYFRSRTPVFGDQPELGVEPVSAGKLGNDVDAAVFEGPFPGGGVPRRHGRRQDVGEFALLGAAIGQRRRAVREVEATAQDETLPIFVVRQRWPDLEAPVADAAVFQDPGEHAELTVLATEKTA